MLTGRESLIRLVGKRRHFLPNHFSILSSQIDEDNPLESCTGNDSKLVAVDAKLPHEDGDEQSGVSGEWVTCPACGERLFGEESITKFHLDACLSRGTKRKLTQRTLLQLNFFSRQKAQIQSCGSRQSGESEACIDPDVCLSPNIIYQLRKVSADAKKDSIHLFNSLMQTQVHGSSQTPIVDQRTKNNVKNPSLINEAFTSGMVATVDEISALTLETFIVGRRFSNEKELHLGTSIALIRDPNNVMDPNAIKVVSADSGYSKMLGFLPRDLAMYLSPLIEKYGLSFEGCVTNDPKNSYDVPIRIMCEKMISAVENVYEIEDFKHLWKNAEQAVNSAKDFLPSTVKYQQNFCLLIHEVLRNDSRLFTDDEKSLMESFTSLSDDSQRLFIRLYMRKGPWFRMSSISYRDVFDPQQAVRELSAAGYTCCIGTTDELQKVGIKEILNLLTVSEMGDIMCRLKKDCRRGVRKQDLVTSLLSSCEDRLCGPLLASLMLAITDSCVRISMKVESLIWRAERLFFMNGGQDLSSFLLVDLGIVKYPTYNCIFSDPIFLHRNDLLAYEEAIEVAQLLDQALDAKNVEMVLGCIRVADSRIYSFVERNQFSATESVALISPFFSAAGVYSKVILVGISFYERERRYTDAIRLLKQLLSSFTSDGRRGYWTLRLSINLEHVGCPNESLSVAEDGLLDPWVRAGSRMALQRRVLRLGKPPRRWRIPSFSGSVKRKITEVYIQGRPLNCETGTKSRFYAESGELCGVEQLALEYYAGEEGGGWQGVHSECGIWLTIFGLLMWEIIFSDVPNVFRTQFQNAPLDLETDSFYVVRKSSIESHLQKIHEGMGEEILIMSWESHMGTTCRGVYWDKHSLSELRAAVTCIGGPCLASLCRHLAQDYRSWSSGMPDLLLWRFHGEYSGEAKLVEVKGPNDRLSEQQRAWLLILMDCGFITEVCKVTARPLS